MSKKSKVLARERRRSEKAKKRSANRAKYESLAGTDANKKKKGDTVGGNSRFKHLHLITDCGNVGCPKCSANQSAHNPWLAAKDSPIYSKRFTSPKWRNAS